LTFQRLHYFQQFFTAIFITFSLILSNSASNVQRTQLSRLRAVRDTFYGIMSHRTFLNL